MLKQFLIIQDNYAVRRKLDITHTERSRVGRESRKRYRLGPAALMPYKSQHMGCMSWMKLRER
jgi:hypothetical protein